MKLYKGKYLIGVYAPIEEGETCLAIVNNAREFAELMNIRTDNATEILRLLFNKKTHYIRYFGKICTVEFILDIEE